MAAQVEVKLGRVCDGAVDCGACWNVSTLPNLQEQPQIKTFMLLRDRTQESHGSARTLYPLGFVRTEETRVVTFLNHDVGDARPVVLLQTDTSLPDGY